MAQHPGVPRPVLSPAPRACPGARGRPAPPRRALPCRAGPGDRRWDSQITSASACICPSHVGNSEKIIKKIAVSPLSPDPKRGDRLISDESEHLDTQVGRSAALGVGSHRRHATRRPKPTTHHHRPKKKPRVSKRTMRSNTESDAAGDSPDRPNLSAEAPNCETPHHPHSPPPTRVPSPPITPL